MEKTRGNINAGKKGSHSNAEGINEKTKIILETIINVENKDDSI